MSEPEHVMKELRKRFVCEGENTDGTDCDQPATTEWTDRTEYNDPDEANPSTYTTYRCDNHPVGDRDYEPRELWPNGSTNS